MKALSIRQPWAWAIMYSGKDIENRDWPTSFRGRIVVHASQGMTNAEYDDMYFFIRQTDGIDAWRHLPARKSLIRGALLGTVEIVDCVKSSESPWFCGEFGFVLRDPKPLVVPIPYRGQLGLFNVPEEIAP